MKSVRNQLTMGLMLLTLGLMLTACGKEGFKIENGKVYYTYWTFSFGQQNRELLGADPETFKSVNDWLGRDAHHVYFKYRLAEGADPATVEAKKYPMFRDKNDYYIEGAALHVADMNTFEVLMHNDMHIWSKDSRYAYFDSTRLEVANIKQLLLQGQEPCVVPGTACRGCRPCHLRTDRQRLCQGQGAHLLR